MSDVENELRSRIDSFVTELSGLIRHQALAAVEEILKRGDHAPAAPAAPARGRGRPPKSAAPHAAEKPVAKAVGAKPAKAPAASGKRKAGEKRTPAELAQITEQVFNYIKGNGGQGVEQIAKALATSTKELTLPIRKLLADKRIGSKGQKRATRYTSR
jgi:hypothetical protein